MEDRLLKTTQAAAFLNCSHQKLEIDRCYGRGIPFVRLGRSVRYRLSDLENYLNASTNERWDRHGRVSSED